MITKSMGDIMALYPINTFCTSKVKFKISFKIYFKVYLEEIVLFNERIINITKSMGDIMVLYPINTFCTIANAL